MPLVTTPAVILHTLRYGETSKIVRLLTRDVGPVSAMAKGALRPKSRFGGRLQLLSDGVAQLFVKPGRDLQTLSEFDVGAQRTGLARDVARYAAGSALAEVVMRHAPDEPQPDLFAFVVRALDRLAVASRAELDGVAVGIMWSAVGHLGFAPHLDACARDGEPLPAGRVAFAVGDGGFLCERCARNGVTTWLDADDRNALEVLVSGVDDTLPLSPRHAAAHRRLLARFVERHVAEDRPLRALDFWLELA
jgi:DNA repair protein RecO (recombination protein O)